MSILPIVFRNAWRGGLALSAGLALSSPLPSWAQIAYPELPTATSAVPSEVLEIAPDPPGLADDGPPPVPPPLPASGVRGPHPRNLTGPTAAPAAPVADQPAGTIDELAAELRSAGQRELHQFEAIQERLEQLREVNQQWKIKAEQERQQREDERRRAAQAEKVAAEARQSAEQAHQVAVQTLRELQKMQQELASRPQAAAPEPIGREEPVPPDTNPTHSLESSSHVVDQNAARSESFTGDGSGTYPVDSDFVSAMPITDAAVDSAALADSLFGAKKFQLAAKIYEQLLAEDNSPHEADWLRYQMAGCYRNLGDWAAAEKQYRMVSGSKADAFLAETSRWWLATLQEQREVTQTLARWQDFLSAQGESTK